MQLRTVEDDYNRLKPVYEAGGISAQQIEQAQAQLDVQREVVKNLKKNIEFRSPITGVVTIPATPRPATCSRGSPSST